MTLERIALIALLAAFLSPGARGSELVLEKGPGIKSPLGYSVRWPEFYTGLRDARDNGMDTIVARPEGAKVEFADMGDIAKIKSERTIVLNVFPQSEHPATLNQLAAELAAADKTQGLSYSSEAIKGPLGPALLYRFTGPKDYVAAYAVGANATYEFIAGAYDAPMKSFLQSLREIPIETERAEELEARRDLAKDLDDAQRREREKIAGLKITEPRRGADGFTGRYGTFFPLKPETVAASRFADDDPTIEVVQFYTEKIPPEALNDPTQFSKYGILTVEILPRLKRNEDVLAQVRKTYADALTAQKLQFAERTLAAPFPGQAYDIAAPYVLTRVFLQSPSTMFKFISGAEPKELQRLLDGMKSSQ